MRKITIDNTKNIHHLEFVLPERSGVYLLVAWTEYVTRMDLQEVLVLRKVLEK